MLVTNPMTDSSGIAVLLWRLRIGPEETQIIGHVTSNRWLLRAQYVFDRAREYRHGHASTRIDLNKETRFREATCSLRHLYYAFNFSNIATRLFLCSQDGQGINGTVSDP